jgi:hypothetical protein
MLNLAKVAVTLVPTVAYWLIFGADKTVTFVAEKAELAPNPVRSSAPIRMGASIFFIDL